MGNKKYIKLMNGCGLIISDFLYFLNNFFYSLTLDRYINNSKSRIAKHSIS